MSIDPVSAVFRLTSFESERDLPKEFTERFQELKVDQRKIKDDDIEKWKEFYEKALELSHDIKVCSKDLIKDKKKTNEKVSTENVMEHIQEIKSAMPLLERSTRNAVNYVKSSRLERQKTEVQKNMLDAVECRYLIVSENGNRINAHFDAAWKVRLMDFVKTSLDTWKKESINGLKARIMKEWSVYEPTLANNLGRLSLPNVPELEINLSENGRTISFPEEKAEKLLTFGAAVVKTMRSSMGLVMMLTMALSPIAMILGKSRGEMRSYVFLAAIPLVVIAALIMGAQEAKRSREQSEKKLAALLLKEMEKTIEDMVNEKYKDIKGDIDRFVSNNERHFNSWSHQVTRKMDAISRKQSKIGTSSSVTVPSRLKYMHEDLEKKIIPELEERIKTIK